MLGLAADAYVLPGAMALFFHFGSMELTEQYRYMTVSNALDGQVSTLKWQSQYTASTVSHI